MIVSKEKEKQIKSKLKKAISILLDFENEVVNAKRKFDAFTDEEQKDIKAGNDHIKNKYHSKDYLTYLDMWRKMNDTWIYFNQKERRIELQFNVDYWDNEQNKVW